MFTAVIDTHAIIWRIFNDPHLSLNAATFLNTTEAQGNQIGLSSISLAEVVYLVEKGRIPVDTFTRVLNLLDVPNSLWIEIPFNRQVAEAMQLIDRMKIPDLHDRMIAATVLQQGVPLISRDARIQVSGITTIW